MTENFPSKYIDCMNQMSDFSMFLTDKNGKYIHISSKWSDYAGLSIEESKNDGWIDTIYPEDKAFVLNSWKDMIENQCSWKMEYRLQNVKTKDIRWMLGKTQRLYSSDGEILGYFGINMDITQQKEEEYESKKNKEILQTIADNSPRLYLSVINDDMKVEYSAGRAFKESGLKPEDFRGVSIEEIYGDKSDIVKNNYLKSFNGEEVVFELFFNNQYQRYNVIPIIEKDGKIKRIISFVENATEELKRVRKQELKSIALLAGGIAHDFNNILMAILGNVSLIKDGILKEEKFNRVINNIEIAVEQATDLTSQLLTFSKGGAPSKKSESLEKLVKDNVNFLIRGTSIKIEYHFESDIPPINVEAGQLNQVISNLIINGIEAMDGKGIIDIYIKKTKIPENYFSDLDEGLYVVLIIEDHGIGIPEEHNHSIFAPYFSTKKRGSGLGLATSYSIVTRHDGLIIFESEVGVGTKFYVYLPASKTPISQKKTKKIEDISYSGDILILDDNNLLLEIGRKMMNRLNFNVITTPSSNEALEIFENFYKNNKKFRLVMLDLTIVGEKSGDEVFKKMKKIDPDLIGIVSSGYSNIPVMSEPENYGFNIALKKPYTFEDLKETISKLPL